MHEFTGLHQLWYNMKGTRLMFWKAERQGARGVASIRLPAEEDGDLTALLTSNPERVGGFLHKRTIAQAELD